MMRKKWRREKLAACQFSFDTGFIPKPSFKDFNFKQRRGLRFSVDVVQSSTFVPFFRFVQSFHSGNMIPA